MICSEYTHFSEACLPSVSAWLRTAIALTVTDVYFRPRRERGAAEGIHTGSADSEGFRHKCRFVYEVGLVAWSAFYVSAAPARLDVDTIAARR